MKLPQILYIQEAVNTKPGQQTSIVELSQPTKRKITVLLLLLFSGVFTEPDMNVPTMTASPYKVDITIQEPTGKFLRYLDKIQYEVMAVELHSE